jgi:hypothetical protein
MAGGEYTESGICHSYRPPIAVSVIEEERKKRYH